MGGVVINIWACQLVDVTDRTPDREQDRCLNIFSWSFSWEML